MVEGLYCCFFFIAISAVKFQGVTNTFHILNCHLIGASELKQVAMVAPSSKCLSIFFFSDRICYNHGFDRCTLGFCCSNIFFKLVNLWFIHQAFHAHFLLRQNDAVQDRKSILLWLSGRVLWHINLCRLLMPNPFLHK